MTALTRIALCAIALCLCATPGLAQDTTQKQNTQDAKQAERDAREKAKADPKTPNAAGAPVSNVNVEQELISLDKEWTAAELRGDKEFVGRVVADDYRGTNPDGTVADKAAYLAALQATTDKDTADEYAVRVFGDTAIMTHRGTVTGQENLQYRSTHVWMKRDGRWQLVAHHSSNITPQTQTQPAGQQPAEKKP